MKRHTCPAGNGEKRYNGFQQQQQQQHVYNKEKACYFTLQLLFLQTRTPSHLENYNLVGRHPDYNSTVFSILLFPLSLLLYYI